MLAIRVALPALIVQTSVCFLGSVAVGPVT